jgi:hypothetical protein
MAEMQSNRPSSALADGAERLARLARTVREQQIADAQGITALPVTNVYSLSPDEVWSKKYMSQGIGPMLDCVRPGGACPMPFTVDVPAVVAAASAPAMAADKAAGPGYPQIGQAIGKPYRKRSWVGRALRGTP